MVEELVLLWVRDLVMSGWGSSLMLNGPAWYADVTLIDGGLAVCCCSATTVVIFLLFPTDFVVVEFLFLLFPFSGCRGRLCYW